MNSLRRAYNHVNERISEYVLMTAFVGVTIIGYTAWNLNLREETRESVEEQKRSEDKLEKILKDLPGMDNKIGIFNPGKLIPRSPL